jgi:signal transduction histidine kinase
MGDETDRALRERVKELECLYEVSRVLHRSDAGLEEALGAIAAILPRGFQYPELAGARVRAGSLDCRTPGFREDGLLLTARFGGGSRTEGAVEVSYPPEITARDPRPFLAEEGPLVERIAGEISLAVERIRAAEDKDRLESQLRHADRLATIGVLSAGIAHELNEPLAMILGFAQLVRKTAGLPEAAGRDISRIVEASLHAREILRGLLSFGRGDTTREEDCDVDGIVASVLGFLEPRCRAERVEVRRELSAGGLTIRADPTELRQVP